MIALYGPLRFTPPGPMGVKELDGDGLGDRINRIAPFPHEGSARCVCPVVSSSRLVGEGREENSLSNGSLGENVGGTLPAITEAFPLD